MSGRWFGLAAAAAAVCALAATVVMGQAAVVSPTAVIPQATMFPQTTMTAQAIVTAQAQAPGAARSTDARTATGTTATGTVEQGKSLFHARCGMCHLEGGTGTFMLGRRLGPTNALLAERTNLDATYVKHVVRNGIVSMPRITRAEVSDPELQAITDYLTRKRASERK